MEHDRDVVSAAHRGFGGCPAGSEASCSSAEVDVGDLDGSGCRTCVGERSCWDEDESRGQVVEIEAELVLRVGRVQRRRRRAQRGQREQELDQLPSVRQGQAHSIALDDPEAGEPLRKRLDVARELVERQLDAVIRHDERGVPRIAGAPDGGERLRRGHARSAIQMVFRSVYFSSEWSDLSRPKPDCLKPPKGAETSPASNVFTQTTPALIARAALGVPC